MAQGMRHARAQVAQIRQTTQYTCCAASISAALKAHGKLVDEDGVNRILGAAPMAGASWEAMLATIQYFGLRGSLVIPSTPRMLKQWTDQGLPVIIAWNPEGRPWSHASVVFDVTESPEGLLIHVMDPNIPNPGRTTRVMGEDEFCQKWGEKVSDSLIVRRPACVVEREVTQDGRQVRASSPRPIEKQVLSALQRAGGATEATGAGLGMRIMRSQLAPVITNLVNLGWVTVNGTRIQITNRGASYSGNPDGKPIYPEDINHGEDRPLGGGTDVMQHLQNQLRIEQGRKPRPENPRIAGGPEWVMDRPFLGRVNDAFVNLVRHHPELHFVLGTAGHNGLVLSLPDYFDDPDFNGGSEYDVYFFPDTTNRGWWSIRVGMTYGTAILKKLAELLRIRPRKAARLNANIPTSMGSTQRVATRWIQKGS